MNILRQYRLMRSAGRSYNLTGFGLMLEYAKVTAHLHEYVGCAVCTDDAINQSTEDVYAWKVLPLHVDDHEVGLIIRLTRHTSSVAAIVLTWTEESQREGDFHVHYVLDNGVVVSLSNLYTAKEFKMLRLMDIKPKFIAGVKWAAIKNFIEQHYGSPSRTATEEAEYIRLDAFIPAKRRQDDRKLWRYVLRGEQTCNNPVPHARRTRLFRELIENIDKVANILTQ